MKIIIQVRVLIYYENLRDDKKNNQNPMTEREREKINARTDRCHACVSYHSLQRQQGTGGHDSWLVDTKQEEKKKITIERTGRTS